MLYCHGISYNECNDTVALFMSYKYLIVGHFEIILHSRDPSIRNIAAILEVRM